MQAALCHRMKHGLKLSVDGSAGTALQTSTVLSSDLTPQPALPPYTYTVAATDMSLTYTVVAYQ